MVKNNGGQSLTTSHYEFRDLIIEYKWENVFMIFLIEMTKFIELEKKVIILGGALNYVAIRQQRKKMHTVEKKHKHNHYKSINVLY